MHGIETKQRHSPGGYLHLREWYDRKRKVRVDAQIRAILDAHRQMSVTDMPRTPAKLPPLWSHKTEVLTGDTVYLGNNEHIRSFVLSALNKAEPETGNVSISSPIGRALLGRHQGDKVHLKTLDGELDYTIIKII